MLEVKDIYQIQSDYAVADGTFRDSEISFEDYVAQCRLYIKYNLPDDYEDEDLDPKERLKRLERLADEFVSKHPVKVKGYVTPEGTVNTKLLVEDLQNMIGGKAVIAEALMNSDIDEIQINDKNTIFVDYKGRLKYFVDSKGRIPQFINNDEIHMLLTRLIDDNTGNVPLLTKGTPILNAKTALEHYRVNAVHFSANARHKPPFDFPISTVVIRKFKEIKLTIDDLIQGGSISEQMGRFIKLLGKAEIKLFCVGPTGSGKTTLLNIIANDIPLDKRIVLIQNPTEISFMERDEYGRCIRNVVHWEVIEAGKKETNNTVLSATMENLISNSLRVTPNVIIVGEVRSPSEFFQLNRVMKTGHKTFGTFHAEDAEDALERFATELSTVGKTTFSESLITLTKDIDIIISQFKFNDGTRRVMEIAEIAGMRPDGSPNINVLFTFEMSGEVEEDEDGVRRVLGEFRQVGGISPRLQRLFFKSGISKDEIKEFVEFPKDLKKLA